MASKAPRWTTRPSDIMPQGGVVSKAARVVSKGVAVSYAIYSVLYRVHNVL